MSNTSGSDQLTSTRETMNPPASTSTVPGVAELLGRSKLYTLLARGFAYPDEGLRRSLTDLLGELKETARSLPNSNEVLSALSPLETAIAEVATPSRRSETPLAGLEEEYTYLFARNAVCPPNEVSYNPEPNWGTTRDLADLSGFYVAFGFGVSSRAGERADYISVEMEFMALLCLKEAYALERGWAEKAEICREARKKFVGEHLWRWLPQFGLRVRAHARIPFYPALVSVTKHCLTMEGSPVADSRNGAPDHQES